MTYSIRGRVMAEDELYGVVDMTFLSLALKQPHFCRLTATEVTHRLTQLDRSLVFYRILRVNHHGRVEVACWASSWPTELAPPSEDNNADPPVEAPLIAFKSTEDCAHPGAGAVCRPCELCGTACYVSRELMDQVITLGLARVVCWRCYRIAGYRDIPPIYLAQLDGMRNARGGDAAVTDLELELDEIREWLAEADQPPEPLTAGRFLRLVKDVLPVIVRGGEKEIDNR